MNLLERENALAALTDYRSEAATGSGRCVLISGEAGIGKTALIRHFVAEADARAFWGYCDGLFTPRPLGPVHDVATELGQDVADALEDGDRQRLFKSVLRGIASPAPGILIIEDAHWADDATLDLLVFAVRRIHEVPALLVVTYRDDLPAMHPLRLALGRVASAASIRRITLPPLTVAAVARLLTARGTDLDPVYVHRETGGNPFFVSETLQAGLDRVPQGVADAIAARTAALPIAAAEALSAAALCGSRVELEVVSEVIAATEQGAIVEAAASGVVQVEGRSLVFRHELVRRALERSVDPTRAKDLHRAILAALEKRALGDEDAARLAYHAEQAGEIERVTAYADAAATAAHAVGAHREAAAQLSRLLRCGKALTREQRAHYLERRSYECYLTDQLADALATQKTAVDAWRALGNARRLGDSLRALSRFAWYGGDRQLAQSAADEAIDILEKQPLGRELAMAYSNRSQLYMLQADYSEAIDWGERAIALAERCDDAESLVHALNNVGSSQAGQGDEGGYLKLERSLQFAQQHGFQEHIARAYTNLGCSALFASDYPTARPYLDAGFTYCYDHDLDSWTLYIAAMRSRLLLEQAEWDAALQIARWLLSQRKVETAITRSIALIVEGLIAERRGGDGEARLVEALDLALPTGEADRIAYVRVARAETRWLRGDLAGAVDEAQAALSVALETESGGTRGLASVWLARVGGQPPEGIQVIEPIQLELRGAFEEAAIAWRAIGCVYDASVCAARSTTRGVVRDAATTLLSLDATAATTALERWRRAAGLGALPRGPRRSTRANPAGLTPREMEILGLLAEGLRNVDIARRLFVSEKTVDHHVSSVLRKLGVPSRGAAAARARELQSG